MTPRRYCLLKRLEAKRRGNDPLASAWHGKQLDEAGTPLPATFPYRARLVAAGYLANEDLLGASNEELQQAGLTPREAAAVLAAL